MPALIAANPHLSNPNLLIVGTALHLPPTSPPAAPPRTAAGTRAAAALLPAPYLVRPGDTLTAIARRLGVSVDLLLGANPQVTNPDLLRAGTTLRPPDPHTVARVITALRATHTSPLQYPITGLWTPAPPQATFIPESPSSPPPKIGAPYAVSSPTTNTPPSSASASNHPTPSTPSPSAPPPSPSKPPSTSSTS